MVFTAMTTDQSTSALAALAASAQAGDRSALDRLVAEVRPAVFRYCLARLLDPHDADDVTQEVTVAMMTAVPRYVETGRPFLAFVFGIAGNKVSEFRRSARRHDEPVETLPPGRAPAAAEPEEAALRLETTRHVAALLDELPADQAELVRLRVVAGLSAEEAGAVLGMTANAVRVAQHRALGRLRTLLTGSR
jgi:RNA polymerase sigma-70 factor (ECF subfamily)